MNLSDALAQYATQILSSVGTVAVVAAVGLACILVLLTVVRR